MTRLSKKKVKEIKTIQGDKYMHEDLEKNFQLNVVIPEIAHQKAILDEQKEQYRKNYEI